MMYFRITSIRQWEMESINLEQSLSNTLGTYRTLLDAYHDIFLNGAVIASTVDTTVPEQGAFTGVSSVGYATRTDAGINVMYYRRTDSSQDELEYDRLNQNPALEAAASKALTTGKRYLSRFSEGYVIYLKPIDTQSFVFLILDKTDMFSKSVRESENTFSLDIAESNGQQPFFFYTNVKGDAEPLLTLYTTSKRFSIDGMVWDFSYRFFSSTQRNDRIIFMTVMIVGIVVLTTIVYQLSQRQYRAQQRAENLERQKDEFVAIASHELKTPLTSIKALTQIVEQKMGTDPNPLYEGYFRKMTSQIKRMEKLINDLLDVSRIRSGNLLYEMTHFDLESVVRTVCDEMNAISRSHRVTVNGAIKRSVYGDRDRITQVVTNLLTNAAKYSPQANLILVNLKESDSEAIVSIQDFGIGITKENQKRIFERFFRVAITEHKYKGLGIGLFITAEIIRKHGGKVWVKSTRGKGSTFFFSLPFHSPQLQ